VLGHPVAGIDARKLPAQPANDVRVWVVLDSVDESAVGGHVALEATHRTGQGVSAV